MLSMIIGGAFAFIVVSALIVTITLRRVVPTNMVHIVQSTKHTTPSGRKRTTTYGRDRAEGDTYYASIRINAS